GDLGPRGAVKRVLPHDGHGPPPPPPGQLDMDRVAGSTVSVPGVGNGCGVASGAGPSQVPEESHRPTWVASSLFSAGTANTSSSSATICPSAGEFQDTGTRS